MNVDLLAAGYNFPSAGSTGSGVYQNGRFSSIILSGDESKMLVSEVSKAVLNSELKSYSCGFKTSEENLENFIAKPLKISDSLESESICFSDFCCHVEYQLDSSYAGKFHYQILLFSGFRTHAKIDKGSLQVCGVVACSSEEKQSCAHGFDKSNYSKDVLFTNLKIRANFTTSYVLPNTLESKSCGPLRTEQYEFGSASEINTFSLKLHHKTLGLHTFALYSHGF